MPANISLDDAAAAREWFTAVVEPLADSFDRDNVRRYVELFAQVLERVDPGLRAADSISRYDRVRQPRLFSGPEPGEVYVLSRVTLGADIAITSVLLNAAKRRFPASRIWFVGHRKGYELFAADPRIGHLAAAYDRTGSVRHRIETSRSLARELDRPDAIVIDPDSRLTQLGLVPVCAEPRYYFFETRASTRSGTLSQLAAAWAEATFDVSAVAAYMAPKPVDPASASEITVSLGVGENAAKRVADPFERELMESLAALNRTILVDKGGGGDESERVMRATADLPNIRRFEGPFAHFAAHVAASRAYVGYDSAGQHAAAAAGVPLVAIFAGYVNDRFVERWRPSGRGASTVLLAGGAGAAELAQQAVASVASALKKSDVKHPGALS